jgi:hypothetical protein
VDHRPLFTLDLLEELLLVHEVPHLPVPLGDPFAGLLLLPPHLCHSPLPQRLDIVILQVFELVQLAVELVFELLGHAQGDLLQELLLHGCWLLQGRRVVSGE